MDIKRKILLIEDDKFIADLYLRVLRGAGYEVDYAQDWFDEIEQGKYDLILLDLMLPKKNGVDILQGLSSQGKLQTPILILSNVGEDKIVEQCLKLGAIGFLLKSSHTPSEVVTRVNEVLGANIHQTDQP